MARGQRSEATAADASVASTEAGTDSGRSSQGGVAKSSAGAQRGKGVKAAKGAMDAKDARHAGQADGVAKGARSPARRESPSAHGALGEVSAGNGRQPRHDFERLERAVTELVDRHALLCKENASLAEQLAERARRVGELEAELEDARERRFRAAKRLDGLIADLDRLDEQLPAAAGDGAARPAKRGGRAGQGARPAKGA